MTESRDELSSDLSPDDGEYLVDAGFDFKWRFAVEYPHLIHSEFHSFLLVCLDKERDPTGDRTAIIEWIGCSYAILMKSSEEDRWDWELFSDPRSKGLEMGKVANSEWLSDTGNPLWKGERSHHFVIAFHDTVFQCIANGYLSRTDPRALVEVLPEVAAEITERWRQERTEWEASEWYRLESAPSHRGPRIGWPWE